MEGLHNGRFILCSQQLLSNVNVAVCDTASISIEKPQEHAAEELPLHLVHTRIVCRILLESLTGHYSIKSLFLSVTERNIYCT